MRPSRIIAWSVVGLCALGLALRALTIKIEPGHTGILNAEWTVGLVKDDFGPGYHFDVGPLHTWTVFDTTVQTLNMSRREPGDEPTRARDEGPLQVKSADGATVTMDVTVKYQIKPGHAWQVFTDNGPGDAYKIKVRNEAIDVLRKELGGLETEQFYDPIVRQGKAAQMEEKLAVRLDAMHVRLVGILIRDLKFDETFEARIREKTLAQQDVELNQAKTEATRERGKTNEIIAQTQAKVVVINQEKEKTLAMLKAENDKAIAQIAADAKKQEIEIKSDADLHAAQKRAAGEIAVKKAEAAGEALRREALEGAGADVYVALELAKSLRLGDMSMSTMKLDPLDIDGIMRRLGVQ
jgi:regulator of protease activity HflC (stomatin/prohibitin superfamily)